MRDIKFRAWDNREMFPMAMVGEPANPSVLTDSHWRECTDKVVLMQFTGLHDKNGKEIYEGDICEGHSDGIGVITWTDFDGGYDYVFTDEANVGIWEVKKDIKIIGNIYENPELLQNE